MYNRPIQQILKPIQRKSELKTFGAPIGGLIANRSLSLPQNGPQGAAVLDNFFPTATSVMLRRGRELSVTLGDGTQDVLSLFSYNFGNNEGFFGSTDTTTYAIPSGDEVYGDGGRWNVVQFGATGSTYLIGVNGTTTGFIYDGTAFWPNVEGGVSTISYDALTSDYAVGEVVTGSVSGATGTIYQIITSSPTEGALILTGVTGTFQDNEILGGSITGSATSSSVDSILVPGVDFGAGVTSANMSFVWVYKNALYFIRKDSLSFYYLPVDSIGGTATEISLAGVLTIGGKLTIGHGWSLDTGQGGGLSEQCAFISDEGEVAIYQGFSPAPDQGWSLVGVYRIGALLGDKAFVRAGADLLISTSIGMVSLALAIQRSVAAIAPQAVSYPINDLWTSAQVERGSTDWQAVIWTEGQMIAVTPTAPSGGESPVIYVVNANTMAWCRFTGWNALCFGTFQGGLYFGAPNGQVFRANVSGYDNGDVYTGVYIPLFDDLGVPASAKIPKMGRATLRSSTSIEESLTFKSDYDIEINDSPSSGVVSGSSVWGAAIWGQGVWGQLTSAVINNKWRSLGGIGYAISTALQVTSGSVAPLDTEIITIEVTYTMGEYVS